MPNHWITTHWPHPDPDDLPWNVYLKNPVIRRAWSIIPGDKVLFRETAECVLPDGSVATHCRRVTRTTDELVPLRRGPAAIVGCATVLSDVEPIPSDQPKYIYGDGGQWTHQAICAPLIVGNYLKYGEMLAVLKLHPRTPATKFGLYEIQNVASFDELLSRMGISK